MQKFIECHYFVSENDIPSIPVIQRDNVNEHKIRHFLSIKPLSLSFYIWIKYPLTPSHFIQILLIIYIKQLFSFTSVF